MSDIIPQFGDNQSLSAYTDLITSEHADKPDFMASLITLLLPVSQVTDTLNGLVEAFDLDEAIGAQLDIVGQWVGQSRFLSTPLIGVYFSFDISGVGFDQGTWKGEFDPSTGLIALPDDTYRTLLRAVIVANQWDGTIPGAYAAWDTVFAGLDSQVLIQNLGNMHMILALLGTAPNAVVFALFTGGYLSLVPAGVMVDAYLVPSVTDTPFFGFDVENSSISGFDVGAWGLSS